MSSAGVAAYVSMAFFSASTAPGLKSLGFVDTPSRTCSRRSRSSTSCRALNASGSRFAFLTKSACSLNTASEYESATPAHLSPEAAQQVRSTG